MGTKLPWRQVHLDFHTSAQCLEVGADFDAQAFARTAKEGHVASMTVFAKCHHGYSYYPTTVGTPHPRLQIDLLGQQIEALTQVGIRAPIYYTIMWDDLAAQQHPEWIIVTKDGKALIRPPLSDESPVTGGWGWSTLDVASGYGDYVLAQVEEICDHYEVDGFFFDIFFPIPSYSPWSMAQMADAGVSADDDGGAFQFATRNLYAFAERLSGLVRAKKPNATIFYNGTVNPWMRQALAYVTHYEIESLPTSGHAWGYLHYPVMARQARTYGVPFLGMTGRFHKSWGDFGGLKTKDQLDYECGTIVAAGGRISVGDQLHPRGALDPAVYRLLEHSFARIEALEPWLEGAEPVAEVGVIALGAKQGFLPTHSDAVEGAAQMLLESAIQFDILDALVSFERYQVLILPDEGPVSKELAARLKGFLRAGGKLLMTGKAGFSEQAGQFALDEVPVALMGPAPTTPSYLRADAELAAISGLADDYDYVFYAPAYVVRKATGAKALGHLRRALFSRTWKHFTSHAHAPVGDDLGAPLLVAKDNIVYLAAPLFGAYRNHDYWVYRALASAALRMLLSQPVLVVNGPGWVEGSLHLQPADSAHPERHIVHLVAYHPRRSFQDIPHVDQCWPTSGVSIEVRWSPDTPVTAYLAPARVPLHVTVEGGYARMALPPIGAHTVVVLEGM